MTERTVFKTDSVYLNRHKAELLQELFKDHRLIYLAIKQAQLAYLDTLDGLEPTSKNNLDYLEKLREVFY